MDGKKVAICLDDDFDESLMSNFLRNRLRLRMKQVYYSRRAFEPFVSRLCQSECPPKRVYRALSAELFSTERDIVLFCGRPEYAEITGEEWKHTLIYSYGKEKCTFVAYEDLARFASLRSSSAFPGKWRMVITVINECLDRLRPHFLPDTEQLVTTCVSSLVSHLINTPCSSSVDSVSLQTPDRSVFDLIAGVEQRIVQYQETRNRCRQDVTDSLKDLEDYSQALEECRLPQLLYRLRQCVLPIRFMMNAVFAKVSDKPCLILRWKEFNSSNQVMVVCIRANEGTFEDQWIILYEEMTVIPLCIDFALCAKCSISVFGTNGETLLKSPVLVTWTAFTRMKSVPFSLPLESFYHIQSCLFAVYTDLGPGLHAKGAARIREIVHATGVAPTEIWLYIT